MRIEAGAGSPNPVVYFEVMGQDADKLRHFYTELLGWQFRMDYPMARANPSDPVDAPGIPGRIGQTGPGHPNWMTFYTLVPDLDAALARARSLGSRVLLMPVRLNGRTIAVVSDPEGHPVGLCAAA